MLKTTRVHILSGATSVTPALELGGSMSGPALAYTYRYAFASELAAAPRGSRLRLATCGGAAEHPYFLQGRLTHPQRTADLLRGLVQIVQSRFHVPPAMLTRILLEADPVVTSSEDT